MKSKVLRELSFPTHVGKVYDENDRLVGRDLMIEDRSDWHRLKKLGAKYYVPAGETTQEDDPPEEEPLTAEDVLPPDPEKVENKIERNRKRYGRIIEKMKEIFGGSLDDQKSPHDLRESFEEDVNFLIDQALESASSLSALSQLRTFDDVTFEHSLNVCVLTILYGNFRDYPREEIEDLAFGALFHDLGKTKISPTTIRKPTNLSDEEWDEIKQHPVAGKKFLENLGARPLYQKIALEHHERPDGTGYPQGRIDVHPLSRVVSVCDVYEALTANRSYKDSLNPLKSFMILKDDFGAFPETRKIVSGLIHCLGIFPVGSLVKLSNGELAIVKAVNPSELRRPSVIVVTDRWERPLTHPVNVNLERVSHQKKGAHGEVYDGSVSIEQLLPLRDHPELESRVTELIAREEVTPV